MRKVIFFDKSCVFIKDEQEALLLKSIQNKKAFKLNHAAGYDIVQPGAIARITNAGRDYQRPDPKVKQIAAPEISAEQRAKNIKKLDKIRADFAARVAKRKKAWP